MREGLSRWREPVAAVLLVAVAARTVVAAVRWAGSGSAEAGSDGWSAATAGDALTVVLLAVLVSGCVLWRPTPHARTLVLLTLVLGALLVLASLVAAAAGLADGTEPGELPAAADLVLLLLLPLVALAGLARLLGAAPASAGRPRDRHTEDPEVGTGATELVAAPDRAAAAEASESAGSAPTWQPDEASGAAWSTAGEAAAGGPAAGWGTAGDDGWRPAGATGWAPAGERVEQHRPSSSGQGDESSPRSS